MTDEAKRDYFREKWRGTKFRLIFYYLILLATTIISIFIVTRVLG